MAHRADINAMAPAQRQLLVDLMLQYITDAVVADHVTIVHSGIEIFTGHRAYLAGMESFLSANGGGAFVPLPLWDPGNPIPPEFDVVKARDDSTPRPSLVNLNPNMPLPPEWRYPAVCRYETGADLGNDINGWHGAVHGAIGGTMGMFSIASAAPIFWCWHAFVDHIYWDWQLCQVPCPDLVGQPLELAKIKLRRNGLEPGTVTRLPRVVLPPERLPVPAYAREPEPYPYRVRPEQLPVRQQAGEAPAYAYASQQQPTHPEHGKRGGNGGNGGNGAHGGHDQPPVRTNGSAHDDHYHSSPPDYSHLLRSPVVISQYPTPGASACSGACVDLVVVEY